ncbi:MAG: agmatine deiminase family protein [Alphaproteobacteria bacterium]|nr:agmatine deiminase family protein [Alphaproteobacteria bacterium]
MNRRHVLAGAAGLTFAASHAVAAEPSAKSAGFHFPLETARHTRTFMQWPTSVKTYGDRKALEDVQGSIADIANAIQRFEPVVMMASPHEITYAKPLFEKNVTFWPFATQDLWCRDAGPSFVIDGKGGLAVSELNFNGWGNKQPHADDAKLARLCAEKLGLQVFDSGVVGEGGGIETDGEGTLMAHASCWVNPNRNKGSAEEVGKLLLDSMGAEKIIWAPGVIGADITDYHIDALARFVKPGQVVIQLPDAPMDSDPWSVAAYVTYDILKKATDANGRKLDIVVIPDPVDIRSREADFVSSYVNYYVCNGAVISAQFGDDKADARAAEILKQLYPDREIVSLDIDPIGESGGGINCATQQPAV